MNVNKVELGVELGLKEESGLKCMQFATQYMLKKAEYRLLNPLHTNECSLVQLHQQSQLMAELNAYCVKNPVLLSKSLQSNILPSIQLPPILINKKSKTLQQEPKQQQKRQQQQQQPHAQPESSVSQYNHPIIIQRTFSQTISNRSSKQSVSSKKSKSKFEKVIVKSTQKIDENLQKNPIDVFDFKKKKVAQLESKQSLVRIQVSRGNKSSKEFTDSDSNSDDSFDNLPLPSAQKQKQNSINNQIQENNNRQSIKSQDLQSYHSSIILSQKKINIDIVSEHPSQNQISVLNESQILPRQIRQTGINLDKRQQQQQNQRRQSIILAQQQQQQRQTNNNNHEYDHKQDQYQQQQDYGKQKQQLLQQIRKYLLKLESFDVQQEILMKKLNKIWTTDSQSITKAKNITWDQLNLPKPSFRTNLHLYAQVIE